MIKTVGIIGAGQRARMLAQAGRPLGLEFMFLDPAGDACAAEFGEHLCAAWDDETALKKLSRDCDVVMFDSEKIPEAAARLIGSLCAVYPPARVLYVNQDRLRQKTVMQELGIPVALFNAVASRPELKAAVENTGLPCVLKTRQPANGGKGREVLRFQEDMERAWQALGDHDLICEGFVNFDAECAIITARGMAGETVFWPLTKNLYREGTLAISMAPAFDRDLQNRAQDLAGRLLEHLDYTGVMALEFFLKDGQFLAKKFTPGVHESGHWSIDGARTSQFENHLRAICGLALGETRNTAHSLTFNLLGEMPTCALTPPTDRTTAARVHWSDYHEIPGTGHKIGHVTVTANSEAGLRARAAKLAGELGVAAEMNLERILQDTGGLST